MNTDKVTNEERGIAFNRPVSGCNLNHLTEPLLRDGYKKVGDWYVEGDFKIKFNKRNITMRSAKGTQLTYANPNKINEDILGNIIRSAMV